MYFASLFPCLFKLVTLKANQEMNDQYKHFETNSSNQLDFLLQL